MEAALLKNDHPNYKPIRTYRKLQSSNIYRTLDRSHIKWKLHCLKTHTNYKPLQTYRKHQSSNIYRTPDRTHIKWKLRCIKTPPPNYKPNQTYRKHHSSNIYRTPRRSHIKWKLRNIKRPPLTTSPFRLTGRTNHRTSTAHSPVPILNGSCIARKQAKPNYKPLQTSMKRQKTEHPSQAKPFPSSKVTANHEIPPLHHLGGHYLATFKINRFIPTAKQRHSQPSRDPVYTRHLLQQSHDAQSIHASGIFSCHALISRHSTLTTIGSNVTGSLQVYISIHQPASHQWCSCGLCARSQLFSASPQLLPFSAVLSLYSHNGRTKHPNQQKAKS